MSRDTNAEPAADPRHRYRGFESVPVRIVARVGCTRLSLARLSSLGAGEVIGLDRSVGTPFDLLAGDRLVGRVDPVAGDDGVGVKLVACVEDSDESSG